MLVQQQQQKEATGATTGSYFLLHNSFSRRLSQRRNSIERWRKDRAQ